MYTKQQEETALTEFERTGLAKATIQKLGYPSVSTLYRWFEHKSAGITNWHGTQGQWERNPSHSHHCNTIDHPRHPSVETKMNILHRCFELGEDIEYVSREAGYSRASIYKWRRICKEKGGIALMSSKKQIPRDPLISEKPLLSAELKKAMALQEQVNKLQLEVDILKETINILKKDQGADMRTLNNREKAVVVSALRDRYTLPILLHELNLPRSSYFYNKHAICRADKYIDLRNEIKGIFSDSGNCYGYRRIREMLKRRGQSISEKIVRRIMKEEAIVVRFVKQRKYNSYMGEISPEVENLIARDFHADTPNIKWLTDITEFSLPAGKVYLSPIIDCFDGFVVSWALRKNPKAELVNSMLDAALEKLKENEKPILHTDRGCQYRWPGWIARMNKAGLFRSMSKKGCSPDNSACEGFFGRLKNEMYYGKSWLDVSIENFIEQVNQYIKWYNEKRIKISLGGMSPWEYRRNLGLIAS